LSPRPDGQLTHWCRVPRARVFPRCSFRLCAAAAQAPLAKRRNAGVHPARLAVETQARQAAEVVTASRASLRGGLRATGTGRSTFAVGLSAAPPARGSQHGRVDQRCSVEVPCSIAASIALSSAIIQDW
jgi:hypothetical protein